ncbi:MAG TPA: hypothetical protein EYH26_04555 [Pyrodictium sp.]|nr:hypothetical protein [Pyrodictium sp.]HIQ11223.1 hypothetical protein [Pyrodictium sp.]
MLGDTRSIINALSKFDGFEWIVVSKEGFPIEFKGVSKSKAEEVAAVLEDAARMFEKQVAGIGGKPSSMTIAVEPDSELLVSRVGEFYYIISVRRRYREAFSFLLSKVSKKEHVKCEVCGKDLTFEVYRCPYCGSNIPFIVDVCPNCGANVRIKECPSCKTLVYSDGRKYEVPKSVRFAAVAGVIGLAVLVLASGLMMWSATKSAVVGGLGILASLTILYLGYRWGILSTR